jgi:hypothetical protein
VSELQQRVVVIAGEQDIDDAALVAECHHKMARRLASDDVAAGVSFELEIAAFAELTGDRQKPAAYPLGVGDRLPDVGLIGRITTLQRHCDNLAALGLLLHGLSRGGANLLGNVDDHFGSSLD